MSAQDTSLSGSREKGIQWGPFLRTNGGLLALAVILVFNILVTPNFLQMQTLFVNISQVATIAIVAMGMTLVIATGGIDLSVGAIMALAGALAPLIFLSEFGQAYPALGIAAAIIVPLIAAIACGLFNGILVANLRVQPIIATLILFISGRAIAQVLANGNLQTFIKSVIQLLGNRKNTGPAFSGMAGTGDCLRPFLGHDPNHVWSLCIGHWRQ